MEEWITIVAEVCWDVSWKQVPKGKRGREKEVQRKMEKRKDWNTDGQMQTGMNGVRGLERKRNKLESMKSEMLQRELKDVIISCF